MKQLADIFLLSFLVGELVPGRVHEHRHLAVGEGAQVINRIGGGEVMNWGRESDEPGAVRRSGEGMSHL